MSRKNKGKRKWRKKIKRQVLNANKKFKERRNISNSKKTKTSYEKKPKYGGQRQLDLYKEIDGIKFLIPPDEFYEKLRLGIDNSSKIDKQRYVDTEIILYETFRDTRGFVSREEAEYIAPQIQGAVERAQKDKKNYIVGVNLPNKYEIGGIKTNRAYIEISSFGWVKYPMMKRKTRRNPAVFGKTPNLEDIVKPV